MADESPVKKAILEVLKEGPMTKDELAQKVAEKVKTQARAVKAVISRLVKKGELKEEGGKISLA